VARYEIALKPSVLKDVRSIPAKDLHRINERIESLADNPRPQGSVKLSGVEYYRVRSGSYRIVYEIVDTLLVVTVIKVGHRRDVYG
jgi:mRNA interferase RelE/StbE